MNWFWRATIAVLVASAYGTWYITAISAPAITGRTPANFVFEAHAWVGNAVFYILGGSSAAPGPHWQNYVAQGVTWFMPVAIVSLLTFGALTRWLGRKRIRDEHTRCRKCGYILRASASRGALNAGSGYEAVGTKRADTQVGRAGAVVDHRRGLGVVTVSYIRVQHQSVHRP